jgi:tetratricopeptide (TPR) repeat protein
LVIGVFVDMVQSGAWQSMDRNAADDYYNLLVQGFRAGQLSLNKEVPPGLARLADPYDPSANAPYRFSPYWTLDLSYYKGRLFLYWGVTPALVLFWPFVALTGRYLFHSQAVMVFCGIGFLASAGLLRGLWRRYFSEVSIWVVVACVLALGLATGLPVILARAQVYEVPVSCGYMLTMLALAAVWRALHDTERRWRWLAAASAAYGLAVAARPTLLFGAVILLVPVAEGWQGRRKIWALLLGAIGPIVVIGSGLMLYNARRFDNPFEFGWHYQLGPMRQLTLESFSPRFLWFNFRVYFLEPARWSSHFPFVQDIVAPALPAGYGPMQTPFGVLTNMPLVWLALAAPLAWRSRAGQGTARLRWFVTAVVLLAGTSAVTIGNFFAASLRYEVEFLPALVLLAAIGILGLERTLSDRPVWRRVGRWGWGALGAFSVAFNLLATANYYAEGHAEVGTALFQDGRLQEAVAHYEQALRIKPDYSQPYNNLGLALVQLGRVEEGIKRYEQALRLNPNWAEAHNDLGVALMQNGRMQGAIGHFQEAVRIKPQYAEAQYNLGVALAQSGRIPEAIEHLGSALRINPDLPDAQYGLGLALEKAGRTSEAIKHYQQAAKLRPGFPPATKALARLGAGP